MGLNSKKSLKIIYDLPALYNSEEKKENDENYCRDCEIELKIIDGLFIVINVVQLVIVLWSVNGSKIYSHIEIYLYISEVIT